MSNDLEQRTSHPGHERGRASGARKRSDPVLTGRPVTATMGLLAIGVILVGCWAGVF